MGNVVNLTTFLPRTEEINRKNRMFRLKRLANQVLQINSYVNNRKLEYACNHRVFGLFAYENSSLENIQTAVELVEVTGFERVAFMLLSA